MVLLKYGERFFLKKAKGAMKGGETLRVIFHGWRARFVSRRISLLKEIETSHYSKEAPRQTSGRRFLRDYVPLVTVFAPFMVIFWTAVANGMRLQVIKDSNEFVEVAFQGSE